MDKTYSFYLEITNLLHDYLLGRPDFLALGKKVTDYHRTEKLIHCFLWKGMPRCDKQSLSYILTHCNGSMYRIVVADFETKYMEWEY